VDSENTEHSFIRDVTSIIRWMYIVLGAQVLHSLNGFGQTTLSRKHQTRIYKANLMDRSPLSAKNLASTLRDLPRQPRIKTFTAQLYQEMSESDLAFINKDFILVDNLYQR
jgi:hypothetical protein